MPPDANDTLRNRPRELSRGGARPEHVETIHAPDAPAPENRQEAPGGRECPPKNNAGRGCLSEKNRAEKPLAPRHEAFCQYFVLGGNATYAARDAGYAPKSSKNQGYRLTRRPRIRARVAEIQSELARAYGLDAQVLLGKLEALYQRAVEDHHFHAGVRAVEAQARIAGHARARAALPALPADSPEMTTHDDFPAAVPAGSRAKSIGCADLGGRK